MNNIVRFPGKPVFECLSAGSDGVVVLFSYKPGSPNHAIGPFSTPTAALAWAVENGAREGVKVDHSSFSRWA